jgi:hypothetical protein
MEQAPTRAQARTYTHNTQTHTDDPGRGRKLSSSCCSERTAMTGRWYLDDKRQQNKRSQYQQNIAERGYWLDYWNVQQSQKKETAVPKGDAVAENSTTVLKDWLLHCAIASWYLTVGVGINRKWGLWCSHTSNCVSTRLHLFSKVLQVSVSETEQQTVNNYLLNIQLIFHIFKVLL